jgi:histidinol-phosphatase (PHP family)
MSIETDFHSHVVRSSALQMVQQAKKSGLRTLGLSEHVFQMSEARPILPHLPQEGPFLTFNDYFEQMQTAAEQEQFDVRFGLEVDFVPEKNTEIQQAIQGRAWDFLIGSVHQIGELQFEMQQKRSQEEGEALWLDYFVLLRQTVKSGWFSLVSHPVRMRVANPFLPPNLDDELESLASEAAHQDVALEINGFDILTYPSLVKRLARACSLHHTPMSVGSDAHDPSQLARGHRLSEEFLREAGITRVRTWRKRIPEEYSIA